MLRRSKDLFSFIHVAGDHGLAPNRMSGFTASAALMEDDESLLKVSLELGSGFAGLGYLVVVKGNGAPFPP